jgi:RNA polymerase sigma-70 factor, ECF subfamily
MAATPSDAITAFPFSGVASAERRPSRLEEEVVSLFEQFRLPVLRYLLSCRVPIPDAEEIIQEVFLALFQHLRRNKPRANLRGWVFTVAHNLALKRRLQAKRHAEHFTHVPLLSETSAGSLPGPEERLQAIERQQRLLAVVRAMPEQDQCCLSLRAEGLRYREIARVLGISLGSVANSLERSLSRLARADERG